MSQPIVIVRAFMGQPMKCVVLDSDGERAAVANPASLQKIKNGESFPVSLPHTAVFEFDEAAYSRLLDEFKASGETRSHSWRSLRPWAGADDAQA
jgi:hypothetical protein